MRLDKKQHPASRSAHPPAAAARRRPLFSVSNFRDYCTLGITFFYLFISYIWFGESVYQYLKYTYDQTQFLPAPTWNYLVKRIWSKQVKITKIQLIRKSAHKTPGGDGCAKISWTDQETDWYMGQEWPGRQENRVYTMSEISFRRRSNHECGEKDRVSMRLDKKKNLASPSAHPPAAAARRALAAIFNK